VEGHEDGDDNDKEPKQCQSRVVWAIGEFFLSFSSCFFILTNILLHIQVTMYIIHDREGVGR
jgi:hypothetical protein